MMKRAIVLGVLGMGLAATSADAGILSLRFSGGATETTMGPSDNATIEVLFQMEATDTAKNRVTGGDFRFDVGSLAAGTGGNFVVDNATPHFTSSNIQPGAFANWTGSASAAGPFNRNGTFVAVGDPDGLSGPLGNATLQAPVVIASFDIHMHSLPPGDTYIVFRQEDPLPTVYNGANAWGNRFGYTTHGAQQFVQGVGNPGDADPRFAPFHGYETLNPLIIHAIPEPSALALLALGGFATLRRRRS